MAYDTLVLLKHQATSTNSTDNILIELDQFNTKYLLCNEEVTIFIFDLLANLEPSFTFLVSFFKFRLTKAPNIVHCI